MKFEQQGATNDRYAVIPRCLIFITYQDRLLLLRGAADKRIWASKLNGIGGHLEPSEDAWQCAQREILEETGLHVDNLTLRGLIHVSGERGNLGVLLFVYMAEANTDLVHSNAEGTLGWYPLDDLPWPDMVDDLPELLPRLLTNTDIVYGVYTSDNTGDIHYSLQCASLPNSTI